MILSASEPTGNTPTERFIESMLASFAQMDNDMRSERTKNGLRARFLAGLTSGTPHWDIKMSMVTLSKIQKLGIK